MVRFDRPTGETAVTAPTRVLEALDTTFRYGEG